MGRTTIAFLLIAGLAGYAWSGTPPRAHRAGMMAKTPAYMAELVGADMMAACHADLAGLGIPDDVRAALEDKRFELQKGVIRTVADLQIFRLELSRLIGRQDFNLTAAQKLVGEISVRESEIRSAHVEFLHALAAALNPEQWEELRTSRSSAGGTVPPMMQGMGPMRHHRMTGHGGEQAADEAEEFFKDVE